MENYINQGDKDTRSGFGEGLTELGRSNENVVALCADLTGSLKMNEFAKEKGNGVDFMMHTHEWHGKAPNDDQLKIALNQNPETLGDY